MQTPFFLRKKFLKYYGLFVLVLLLVGIAWTALNYFEAKESGGVRWEIITVPMSLPIIGLVGYGLLFPFWVLYKVKEFQQRALNRMPDLLSRQEITLEDGEEEYCDADLTAHARSGSMPAMGVFRITNQRMMHTKTISVKRMGVLYGMDEPDVTYSIPLREIRQCGFGLDEKRPEHFAVITNTGETHTFGPMKTHNVEAAIDKLRWKKTRIDQQVYWVR